MVEKRNEKYFNAIYPPSALPGQLNVGRAGEVMCAQSLAVPWSGGVWDYCKFYNDIKYGRF